jgi:hypothetical protein
VWAVALALLASLALWYGSDPRWIGSIMVERIAPMLAVPVFTGMALGDDRHRMRDLVLATPRATTAHVRRLAIATLGAAAAVVLTCVLWNGRLGLGLGVTLLCGIAPALLLGSVAFLTAALVRNEGAAIAIVFLLWLVEQVPTVYDKMGSPPLSWLYLFPMSSGDGVVDLASKAGQIALACAIAGLGLAASRSRR